jgi:ribulose-phosphate 3-epimerase
MVLPLVQFVLVMSVNPGFGGQKFIPSSLEKIRRLAMIRAAQGYAFRIEVDGGISPETAGEVVRAGAEVLVAGSSVFSHGDIRGNVEQLLQVARQAIVQRA